MVGPGPANHLLANTYDGRRMQARKGPNMNRYIDPDQHKAASQAQERYDRRRRAAEAEHFRVLEVAAQKKLDDERAAAERQRQQEQAKRDEEARAKAAAELEARLKASFMAVPGATEADWTREKPAILAAYRQRAALDEAARRDGLVAEEVAALRETPAYNRF
ncbi:MAG: hypothetical protein M3R02_15115 [Chloroflexota bacterium]|nr:hypothetical protein [Chloroflexota bacterium]